MRSSEELDLAAALMTDYAARWENRLLETGMTPLWDTDAKVWDQRKAIDNLRKLQARVNVAKDLAEILYSGDTAERILRNWVHRLIDTPVDLDESGDAQTFWCEYRMEVNFARWLLGVDWPNYCTMWRLDVY